MRWRAGLMLCLFPIDSNLSWGTTEDDLNNVGLRKKILVPLSMILMHLFRPSFRFLEHMARLLM